MWESQEESGRLAGNKSVHKLIDAVVRDLGGQVALGMRHM